MFSRSAVTIALMSAVFGTQAATYEITELDATEQYRQHFALDINDSGEIVGVARDSFSFPFYQEEYLAPLTTLGIQTGVTTLEYESGNFDATSTSLLKAYLASSYDTSPYYQKVGDSRTFYYNGGSTTLINLTDEVESGLGDYTRSTVEQLSSINNNGLAVGFGSAPYLPYIFEATVETTNDDGDTVETTQEVKIWEREYANRAVVYINGLITELEPEFNDFGGISVASDVSETGFVAGYESTGFLDSIQENIDEDCDGLVIPANVCVWSKQKSSNRYDLRPVVWQVDGAGNLVGKTQYPLVFEPNEDQTSVYTSVATAVNDAGVGVGYGHAPISTSSNSVRTYPLIYQGGETRELLDEHGNYYRGYAVDVNNDNLIVGHVEEIVDNALQSKFFIYNMTSGEIQTPTTFYESADSTVASINDNNMLVGQAEYEITNSSTKRVHAFLYDINNQRFNDLNDLVECASEFEIVEARSINNNNEIVATALKLVDKRDSHGEVVLDDNGDPEKEEIGVTLKLTPIEGGEIEDCSVQEDEPYERQGFSFGLTMSFLLAGFVAIRRRFL